MFETIAPTALLERKKEANQLTLIDVRTPAEFQEVHVEFAQNHPLDRLQPERFKQFNDSGEPVYVICKSGSRGKMACQKLQAAGLENVINIEGGTDACVQAGLPVLRGKKVMSLERQVRIAAGSLVLLGAILGLVVHPYWIGLSGFVGAGLIFAGLTDTCGMGMMLAKMPWNQAKSGSSCGI